MPQPERKTEPDLTRRRARVCYETHSGEHREKDDYVHNLVMDGGALRIEWADGTITVLSPTTGYVFEDRYEDPLSLVDTPDPINGQP